MNPSTTRPSDSLAAQGLRLRTLTSQNLYKFMKDIFVSKTQLNITEALA